MALVVLLTMLAGCQLTLVGSASPFGTPTPLPELDIRPAKNRIKLSVGQKLDLEELIEDEEWWETESLWWTSSDPDVVAVDEWSIYAEGVRGGTAVLTGSLEEDGYKPLSIRVVVDVAGPAAPAPPSVKFINVTPDRPVLPVGQEVKLVASVKMANGEVNANVAWSTSDATIAVVNPTNGVVSAVREGKVTIIAAYAPDMSQRALVEVTVAPQRSVPSDAPTPPPDVASPSPQPSASASPPNPLPTGTPSSGLVLIRPTPTPLPSSRSTPTPIPTASAWPRFPTPWPSPYQQPTSGSGSSPS
jgi:hypothetical protein